MIWKLAAGLALVVAVLLYAHHRETSAFKRGYEQAASESAAEAARQEMADAMRITKAYRDRDQAREELAAIRARPVPRLVCRRAPQSRVPEPRLPNPKASDAGPLPGGAAESLEPFDPTGALIMLADEADDLLANCRMLHQAVHGFPSAP